MNKSRYVLHNVGVECKDSSIFTKELVYDKQIMFGKKNHPNGKNPNYNSVVQDMI